MKYLLIVWQLLMILLASFSMALSSSLVMLL
jgi:hypothetical protein